jgi:hypothetical protein
MEGYENISNLVLRKRMKAIIRGQTLNKKEKGVKLDKWVFISVAVPPRQR